MSDSVPPHRRQPTRLCRPWDSPGKNTGVGGHFLHQCMKVESESEVAQSCPTLRYPMGLQPTKLLRSWDSPGQNTGVGSLSLLQGIFPTQGSNPGLQHLGQILYQLSHKGSPLKFYGILSHRIFLQFFSFCFLFCFVFLLYFTLQYCIGFAIH